ncbi:MAG: PIG-L family deacetylase [Bdellovibrionota bacterium]
MKFISAFFLILFAISACAFKLPNASLGLSAKDGMHSFIHYESLPQVPVFDGDLFMIFAHADDELLTLSYVARMRKLYPEKAIHWILVSNSGKGLIIPTACGLKNAVDCRRLEAQKAADCIGIKHPYEMKLPDGGINKVKNLDKLLAKTIKKLTKEKVGLILTHDVTGVYGHADHITIHDTLKKMSQTNNWPMLTAGIPPEFRENIKMRGKAGKGRVDVPVTHIFTLDEELKKQMVCAIEAHDSQKFLLWLMRRFMTTEGYLDRIPLQFYNLEMNQKE